MTHYIICADCRIFHIKGDLPEDPDRAIEVEAGADETGRLIPDYEKWGDGYEEFTWAACEACGSKEGGERYRFRALDDLDDLDDFDEDFDDFDDEDDFDEDFDDFDDEDDLVGAFLDDEEDWDGWL